MSRFAAFLSGIALGAVLMALLVYGLWGAPSFHFSAGWPRASDTRFEPAAAALTAASLRKEEGIELTEPPAAPSAIPLAPVPTVPISPVPTPAAPVPTTPTESAPIPPEPATLPIDSAESAVGPPPPLSLLIPVAGVQGTALYDTFTQARGSDRVHEAIDIMAPRGTPVIAAENGHVAKLFNSAQGGLTVYQFDASGRYALYYAHLDAYAPGLVEGTVLKRGDPIGTVGSTGNANPDGPHLHFAVFLLGPERRWWKGTAINPFPLLER